MPRNKNNDSPIGKVICERLEEMERSQSWLAKKVNRSTGTVAAVIKGRLKPSHELVSSISFVIEVDKNLLFKALDKGINKNGWTLDNHRRSC